MNVKLHTQYSKIATYNNKLRKNKLVFFLWAFKTLKVI